MNQVTQDLNPNNSRIFIDYRKSKNEVKFEPVGKKTEFGIVLRLMFKFYLFGGVIIPLLNHLFILSYLGVETLPNIYQIGLLFVFIDISIALIVGATLIWINNKKLMKLTPYLYSLGTTKYLAKFNKEDIKDKKIEIPLFSNVMLDYKATESFSEYLYRVEIVEHPFNRLMYKRKKKEWIKKPQEYLWKGIFYFSQLPKSGELMVAFN